ncbi:formate dehydrogenase-N subunit gamma [Raoultella planticola]|uniref:formate dehydrogenase-N subunit gamma n=1 Tax=Raoultella planticola TaxID=575 RepID=UPI00062B80DD|nr:formate dehydrogenase-N subunit gamma [Raoultella planticola]
MNKSKMIVRTKFIDRACHWTVVICFFLVALSGISFFFPTLQWLTETFGTPQMGRILHPFFGVAIFIALMFMFVRFVHHNIPDKQDIPWLKGIIEVLKGNEHKVARVGKYNAGQKMMFWTIMSMIFVLLVTGVIIWRPWFAPFFPIQVIRYSLLIHATSAIILIHAILIHMYMAFWVKGSIKGMVEGKVSRRWASKHHPRWYREVERLEAKKESLEGITSRRS